MYTKAIKRILDIIVALIMLPLVLFIGVFIAIAIKIDDKGPVLYNGLRLGQNKKNFKMLKFRSMKVNAPDLRNSDGSTFNSKDDFRQTKIGKILRKTSLDELPQIINVLKGDMSFVGPRPSPLGNEDLYSKEYLKKFNVKPGITGLNQATLRNDSTMQQREQNDIYYVENISFCMDLKIIILTIKSVVLRKNIYKNEKAKDKNDQ